MVEEGQHDPEFETIVGKAFVITYQFIYHLLFEMLLSVMKLFKFEVKCNLDSSRFTDLSFTFV